MFVLKISVSGFLIHIKKTAGYKIVIF